MKITIAPEELAPASYAVDVAERSTLRPVALDALTIEEGKNARLNYAIEGLVRAMSERGQDTPVLVSERADGTLLLLRGHRRHMAAKRLGWESLAAQVVCGLTPEQEELLRADHGETLALEDRREHYKEAAALFAAGLSERAVAIHLDPLFLTHSKPSAGRLEAESTGDKAKIDDATFTQWRGLVQHFHAIARLPLFVEEHYLGGNDPAIGRKESAALLKAHTMDMQAGYKGSVKLGPEARAVWDKLCEPQPEGEKQKKARSAKSLEETAQASKSMAVRTALLFAAGEDVNPGAFDRGAAVAEACRDHNKELWAQVEDWFSAWVRG